MVVGEGIKKFGGKGGVGRDIIGHANKARPRAVFRGIFEKRSLETIGLGGELGPPGRR